MANVAIKTPFAKPLNIAHMLRNTPPPLDHVLPGLLAETVGLIVGPGAVSKTMLTLQIAIAMATGTAMLNGLVGGGGRSRSEPKRVVVVLAEESATVVWHRLHAIASVQLSSTGIDSEEAARLLSENLVVHAMAGLDQVNLVGPTLERTQVGEMLLRACNGARLVILDPIRDFHNADENDTTAMKALARHIASYATSTGAAWLLVHHTSRAAGVQGYGGTADASRGSTALTNAVRWQLNLSRPTKETAKQHGLPFKHLHQRVLLDIPKANYIESPSTLVLARGPHGVLMLAEDVA